MNLKLLKIKAIMKRFNCSKAEAFQIKKTGKAPSVKADVKKPKENKESFKPKSKFVDNKFRNTKKSEENK